MLNQPYIPEMNSTWSLYISLPFYTTALDSVSQHFILRERGEEREEGRIHLQYKCIDSLSPPQGLGHWLSRQHWLFFQKPCFQYSEPIWQLTVVYNSSPRDLKALFLVSLNTKVCMWYTNIYRAKLFIHKNKNNFLDIKISSGMELVYNFLLS